MFLTWMEHVRPPSYPKGEAPVDWAGAVVMMQSPLLVQVSSGYWNGTSQNKRAENERFVRVRDCFLRYALYTKYSYMSTLAIETRRSATLGRRSSGGPKVA